MHDKSPIKSFLLRFNRSSFFNAFPFDAFIFDGAVEIFAVHLKMKDGH